MIARYLHDEIEEKTYGAAFQELVRRHMALEHEKKASWPERYDVKIEQAYLKGTITQDQFNQKWRELWGEKPKWHDIVYLDLVYLGDRRPGSEEILQAFQNDSDEYNRTYFLTEVQLKDELRKYLEQLEKCDD